MTTEELASYIALGRKIDNGRGSIYLVIDRYAGDIDIVYERDYVVDEYFRDDDIRVISSRLDDARPDAEIAEELLRQVDAIVEGHR